MRAIYMGKDKPSAIHALRHLLESGVEVVCVVAPPPGSATNPCLADAARDLGLPLSTDRALYDRLAGDERAAPGVGRLENVDLVLSFLFWKRIRRPLIELPRMGCLNFHPAPLPDFRGLGGYNVAILEDLPEWGVSAHFVEESFDTGDLVKVERFPIDATAETAYSLEQRTQRHLLRLFQDVLALALGSDPLPRTPQGAGRYIDRQEFERMRRIDLDEPADHIERKIRAFWYPPYRGATVELDGEPFTLVSDVLLEEIATQYGGD